MYSDPNGHWVIDTLFLAYDTFILNPSLANAAWILFDIATYLDPTGVVSSFAHAKRAEEAAKLLASSGKLNDIFTAIEKGGTKFLTSLGDMVSGGSKAEKIAEGAGKGTFGPNTVGAAERYVPKNIKMVDEKVLKKNGLDAHQIKDDVVGGNISKYDIYVDKDTNQLWVYGKGGKGEGIPTGEYIKK